MEMPLISGLCCVGAASVLAHADSIGRITSKSDCPIGQSLFLLEAGSGRKHRRANRTCEIRTAFFAIVVLPETDNNKRIHGSPMPDKLPITLQMYTVRDDAARDFAATAETLAQIGYAGVELAGYGSAKTAEAVRSILDDNGLMVAGMHVSLDVLENDLSKAIEEALMVGSEFISCPFLGADRRQSLDDYKRLGAILNDIGARLKESEIQLCYHNHDFEFEKFGGDVSGFDALFAAADKELVKVEMDTYWVKRAGEDPAAYLRKYAGRVPLVHLKDMTPGENPTFAEVGEGIIDYPSLFEAAKVGGALYYVVEQDRCEKHAPLESVRISFENLKKMGMA